MKKDRILILAILFSAVWHVFCLSAFTVVVVPKAERNVKFSSVSFLGTILERGALNVNVEAHEEAPPGKNYLASMDVQLPLTGERPAKDGYVLPAFDAGLSINDEEFIALAIAGIDTDKIEPGRDVD